MDDTKNGIVYVLSNPAMPGMVKIGLTTRDKVEDRIKELSSSTSIPVPFECEFACRVNNCKNVETALHTAFYPHRINPNREFFKIEAEQAVAILKLLSQEDVTPGINAEIVEHTTQADREAGEILKKQRRPPLNFMEMGIPVGSKLVLASEDNPAEAEVISDKKLMYNGQEYSLTALTSQLLKIDYAMRPTRYWYYNGRNLSEIYNETYQE